MPFFLNRLTFFKHKKVCSELSIQTRIIRKLITSNSLLGKVSFNLSDIGEGIREVVIKEWFIKIGDKVSQFDNICEVQSDKASVTITSRYDGTITKLHYDIDEVALVGKPLIDLETDDNTTEDPIKTDNISAKLETINEDVTVNKNNISNSYEKVLCIPLVRQLAKEHKIDLTKVKGTGKDGRIIKEDVLKYLEVPKSKELENASVQTIDNVVPLKGFTKAMFKTMTEALKIPHFVYSDEIKVTTLSKLRKELKLQEVKLTFLPFFVKAASNALQRYPLVNSSLDENCENIIYHKDNNIGIAMDTKEGLAVPVIKNVESKTVLEIAIELNRLITNGKNGIFSPNDLSGATFSISNIGIVGGTYTKPVILPPQVAIIALGIVQVLPRYDSSGNIKPEEIINVSGSADHRIIDGVTMANFIKTIKKQIENPNLLFLNL
ncbi:dihydrolipoamide branched chain transacylase E2 [Rhynchophorus ferrugineus]|uniref:dihydrolipoamide branched chain transacylase E2 n=1 Tax=Rhynchophorus ferrugineus TaxID=354439 RepID=UPI003FCC7A32